jgi:broad-specificity NMP kinase
MPLILITGIPSSGKSTRTLQIKSFLEDVHEKTVYLVSENNIIAANGAEKNVLFLGESCTFSLTFHASYLHMFHIM